VPAENEGGDPEGEKPQQGGFLMNADAHGADLSRTDRTVWPWRTM
jgi:hypothetical protein